MWRWIVRVYVSFVVFWIFLFMHGLVLIAAARLLGRAGFPLLQQWIHAHVVLAMFLLGVTAGQGSLGSKFTGEGWFRSKDGQTYEGFKLDELKPWTWLLVSPVFLLGVFGWCMEQSASGVLSRLSFANLYQGFLMLNCSNIPLRAYQINIPCTMQFLFVGTWMASIGYSLAPIVRKRGASLLGTLRHEPEAAIPMEESRESSMKEKADLQ